MSNILNSLSVPGYQIVEQLYIGSRTVVYRAIRNSDSLRVVIKILGAQYPTVSELLQFRMAYTIAKNLNVPSIVYPLALETYRNGYMLVMEDFGAISLREYINMEAGCVVSLEEFLNIALQLTEILQLLYSNRVIHKDIKPANILIHPETKQLKLIDFSIASLLPKETQEIKSPNTLEGTLAYISPEQTARMNRGVDYRSDFYSLGVTLYELVAGSLPFSSDNAMELVYCHIAKLPPPLKERGKEIIPQVIADIIMKLMAKNAEDRYQTALGLKYDLETCLYQLKSNGKIINFEIAQRDICDKFIIHEKLYGRDKEIQVLLNTFGRVSGGSNELILVAGFSGIGKTAVVNQVHKPIVKNNGYFIKGKYDQFKKINSQTVLDKLAVYEAQIQAYSAQKNYQKSIDIGLEFLQFLGIKLPSQPSQLQVIAQLIKTKALLHGKSSEKLLQLPVMTNLETIAVLKISNLILYPAFFIS